MKTAGIGYFTRLKSNFADLIASQNFSSNKA